MTEHGQDEGGEVDRPGYHPNPQMQKYQLLAAGETIDLVYFGGGSASLLKPGTARFEGDWVIGQDWSDNEVAYPTHRVEYVHTKVEIPEIEDEDVSDGDNAEFPPTRH